MKKVTFIHAADLHLDSPMIGLRQLPPGIFQKIRESTFDAFNEVINAAIRHQADFVILAGDLYDGDDRSIRAQAKFRQGMERLAENGISVFAVHGNHDHMEGSWADFPFPDNVRIFSHDVETVKFTTDKGISVHLYGFSYPKRHVFDRMIERYEREEGADFHIGILHGHCEGKSDHGKYAPFTVHELLGKSFDYWALGHIHKMQILSEQPPVVYPGNTQGRNRKETGRKGCYLIHLDETGAEMEFLDTAEVTWEEKVLDSSEAETFHDLYMTCRNAIEESRKEKKGTLLSLHLKDISLPAREMKGVENGELLEMLQDKEKDEHNFVWVSGITIKEQTNWNKEQLSNESGFYKELFNVSGNLETLDEAMESLLEQPLARRFLEDFSEEEKAVLAEEAEKLLVSLLYEEEKERLIK